MRRGYFLRIEKDYFKEFQKQKEKLDPKSKKFVEKKHENLF